MNPNTQPTQTKPGPFQALTWPQHVHGQGGNSCAQWMSSNQNRPLRRTWRSTAWAAQRSASPAWNAPIINEHSPEVGIRLLGSTNYQSVQGHCVSEWLQINKPPDFILISGLPWNHECIRSKLYMEFRTSQDHAKPRHSTLLSMPVHTRQKPSKTWQPWQSLEMMSVDVRFHHLVLELYQDSATSSFFRCLLQHPSVNLQIPNLFAHAIFFVSRLMRQLIAPKEGVIESVGEGLGTSGIFWAKEKRATDWTAAGASDGQHTSKVLHGGWRYGGPHCSAHVMWGSCLAKTLLTYMAWSEVTAKQSHL